MADKEKMQALGLRILEQCRMELMGMFPHLDAAFAALPWSGKSISRGMGADGAGIAFAPEELLRLYSLSPAAARRLYLHTLLHCLFLHPFRVEAGVSNLALDMAVEQIIESQKQPRLTLARDPVREKCFAILGEASLSPRQIQGMLADKVFPYTISELTAAFCRDDHSLWRQRSPQLENKWQAIAAASGGAKRGGGRRGRLAGDGTEAIAATHRRGHDYRSFLRRFTVTREEMELDTESFDLGLYNFSMDHYGDLPLMEALEYKEVSRLEELVIAIDTSGSCSREMVEQFLAETYAILTSQENFFHRMKVYLIQCDCMVQSVRVIRSKEDWLRCSRDITIQGRGGTDFDPVFRYVRELREKKELKDLKALLYFTDGDGAYPREKPDYEAAFVFLKKCETMDLAPPWARKLIAGDTE